MTTPLARLALIVLTACLRVSAQSPLEGFADYAAKATRDWEVPGLAVAVVKDGEVAFMRGFGVRRLGADARVDEHTLFAIGSTTKAMTAAALGMLVDDGKLGWDDRVIDHLPRFQLHDPYVTREIRIRDLLTHRAGLGNADYLWYGVENTTDEILRRVRYVEPAYSMRAGFIYQNIMYAAAGQVIATVSGTSWADFVQRRIFAPLGMNETIPTAAVLAEQQNVAAPHYKIGGKIEVVQNASVDAIPAAGAVWSSVGDMSKWTRFLLAGGKASDDRRLLSRAAHAELFAPQVIIDPSRFYPTRRLTKPHWTTYALGWFQHDYRGRMIDFHTGSIDGMVAIHGLIRDEQIGVVVLGNLNHAEVRHALMYRVFDAFSKDTPRDWSAELADLYAGIRKAAEKRRREARGRRVMGTRPSLKLESYAGTYSHRLYGSIRVTVRDGGLYLIYGRGLQGKVAHWHYDTFRVAWNAKWRGGGLVTFRLGWEGKATKLELPGRTFQRK